MASSIEPDILPTPAAPPAKPAPAAAKPAAPAAKPAAKPPAAKPATSAAADGSAEDDEEDGDGPRIGADFLKQTPAWAVSMLVHIVALLAMALMVTPPPEKEKVRMITSSAPEVEDPLEEPVEEPIEQPELPTEVVDVVAPTDVSVVEDVKVVSEANDVDAAPLTVEMSDFGNVAAPVGMMTSIGAVGGTGAGGLGGRANAKGLAAKGGGGADTEAAVDRALKWFIAHQMPDGGWSFDLKACPNCAGKCSHGSAGPSTRGHADRCAATAMVMLPFLGRGYTHKEGPYKQQLEAAVAFLAGLAQKGKGQAYQDHIGSFYSQGLAGIALSESYAMTQDPRLAMPAQLTLNFIMQGQDPVGGGWRYTPKQPGDTSIVGWQIMALKSGHMAYLQIDPNVIKKASDFLDSVEEDSGSAYGYTEPAWRSVATTAVGLLCRMYLGWDKTHPSLQRGVDRLAKLGPSKDLYYSYYATQIMHHMEGDTWTDWNSKMKALLLPTQATKGHEVGSWYEGVDGGHAHGVGRMYTTAMATMMLEVYYRHLPLYGNKSVDAEFKE